MFEGMMDLEDIKRSLKVDLEYIHIDRDGEKWRRIMLVLIERLQQLEAMLYRAER